MEVHGGIVEVHQAALVDHDRDAVELEHLIQLGIDGRIEIELVLETAAATPHDAHAQIDLFRQALLLAQDALDLAGCLFGNGNRHC